MGQCEPLPEMLKGVMLRARMLCRPPMTSLKRGRRHRQHGWQRKKRATVATLLYAVILQQRRVLLGGATGNRWLETATAATNVGEGKKIRKRV
ncbi:hypothetical protein BHE74_00044284 [Ensete ventricosum]|nr:hypothetical protein BHE74_00044284 [Ensete ventricosum]